MLRGTMWNLIIGGIFIVGGLTGKLALIGTNSSGALVVVGFGLAGWGARISSLRRSVTAAAFRLRSFQSETAFKS